VGTLDRLGPVTMAHNVVTLRDERGVGHEVTVEPDGSITAGGRTMSVRQSRGGEIRVGERTLSAAADGELRWIFIDGQVYVLELHNGLHTKGESTAAGPPAKRKARRESAVGAPMPATVVKVVAAAGDQVKAGDVLIILEAMKMELPVRAAVDGTVRAVRCREGELVQPGEELVEIEPPALQGEPPAQHAPALLREEEQH
jgi:biotin carboxyl carrier protein